MIFDLNLVQKEFERFGFGGTFEKLRLQLACVCEGENNDFINLYMLSETLNIMKNRNIRDFSFEKMVLAIELAEKIEMDIEDFINDY